MKVCVAGAAGFLGVHLAEHYLRAGHEVFGIDHLGSGSKANISYLTELFPESFTFLNHDISNPLPSGLPSFDLILHFASRASPPDYQKNPFDTIKANTLGTYFLCERAKRDKARFLFASTSETYGNPPKSYVPTNEFYWGNVNYFGPRACYDEAKRLGETIVFEFLRQGVDAFITRTFNTYGPFMRVNDGRVVTNFINQALSCKPLTIYGSGNQGRCYCFVDDQVDGLVTVASLDVDSCDFTKYLDSFMSIYHKKVSSGEWQSRCVNTADELRLKRVFNVGNPFEHYSVKELSKLILKLIPESASEIIHKSLPENDPVDRVPDISKLMSVSKWSPSTTLKQGLVSTIDYFRRLNL